MTQRQSALSQLSVRWCLIWEIGGVVSTQRVASLRVSSEERFCEFVFFWVAKQDNEAVRFVALLDSRFQVLLDAKSFENWVTLQSDFALSQVLLKALYEQDISK